MEVVSLNYPSKLERTVLIENLTSSVLEIVPVINFPLLVSDLNFQASDSDLNLTNLHLHLNGKQTRSIQIRPMNILSMDLADKLESGERVPIEGDLQFKHEQEGKILQSLQLSASCVRSLAELDKVAVDLGRLGSLGKFDDVPFTFKIRNRSSAVLIYEIPALDFVEIEVDEASHDESLPKNTRMIAPWSSQPIQAKLKPQRLKPLTAGPWSLALPVINRCNPSNQLSLKVNFQVSLFQLKFGRLSNGELLLPAIYYPQPDQATPCDSWFQISNASDEEVKFDVTVELSPEVTEILSIDVMSRFSNSLMRGLTALPPQGTIDIKIRATARLESRRLSEISRHLANPDGVTFGRVCVNLRQPDNDGVIGVREDIPLRGTIVEGQTFDISSTHIDVAIPNHSPADSDSDEEAVDDDNQRSMSKQALEAPSETIFITNRCKAVPLRIKIVCDMPQMTHQPAEFAPVDENGIAHIPPGGRLPIVLMFNRSAYKMSELKISFLDADAINTATIDLMVHFSTMNRASLSGPEYVTDSEIEDNLNASLPGSPVLIQKNKKASFSLRGCKKITTNGLDDCGRFELDFGQQDLGSSNISKKLLLENEGFVTIPYRIRLSGGEIQGKPWLMISKTAGQLEPCHGRKPSDFNVEVSEEERMVSMKNLDSIVLTVLPLAQNSYVAYLVIENLSNPSDTKIVRISMEVVALQSYRRLDQNRIFDVITNGADTLSDLVEMENIFYYSEYSSRSLLIVNRESIPLEFTVSFANSVMTLTACRLNTTCPRMMLQSWYFRFHAVPPACSSL